MARSPKGLSRLSRSIRRSATSTRRERTSCRRWRQLACHSLHAPHLAMLRAQCGVPTERVDPGSSHLLLRSRTRSDQSTARTPSHSHRDRWRCDRPWRTQLRALVRSQSPTDRPAPDRERPSPPEPVPRVLWDSARPAARRHVQRSRSVRKRDSQVEKMKGVMMTTIATPVPGSAVDAFPRQ